MKFQKPSEQSLKDTVASAGGVVVGSMASKAVFGMIHNPDATTDPTQQKKNSNKGMIIRGVLAAAGFAIAASLDGKDAMTNAAKGAAIGLGAHQTLELIATVAAKSNVPSESTAKTTAGKMLARAVGLGCPCNEVAMATGLGNPAQSMRYDLSIPSYADNDYRPFGSGQSLLNNPILQAAGAMKDAA